jgi:heterodisulfide reductase subunit C
MRRLGLIRYDADQAAFYREKLVKRVQTDVRECYQCGNCSAGCPAAFTFDYTPNQLMRMLQIGLVDKVLDSKAIQLCVQCLTCTARCPRNIDIAGIIEDLKTMSVAQERDVPEHVKTFNKAFMSAIARFGRLPEFYDMATFYMATMNPKMALGNVGLMVPVMSKRKMPLLPRRSAGAAEVGRIYKKAMAKAAAHEKADLQRLAKLKSAAYAAARVAAAAPAAGAHGGAHGASGKGESEVAE